MTFRARQPFAGATIVTMLWTFLDPRAAAAQDHVVPSIELIDQLRVSAEARTSNIADLERVLALPAAREALSRARVSQSQLRTAVALLSDAELSRLADRARAVEQDVQAGIVVGILALIGLIVVIIVVLSVLAAN